MATVIRNTEAMIVPFAAAFNDLKLQIGAGAFFHLDKSETILTAAVASDLATSLTLVNNMLGVYAFHMADTLAHKVAGVALASYVQATDLASAILRANDIKAKYNTHCASTVINYAADATNTTTSADSTDLASLITLLNEMRTDIAAHMQSGPAAKSLRVVSA